MAGDGVSLPTTLAQLGNLARTQARGPTATHGPNVAQELQKQDVTPVNKVAETEKSEQDGVDPDEQRKQERRGKKNGSRSEDAALAESDDTEDEYPDECGLGGVIDIKA